MAGTSGCSQVEGEKGKECNASGSLGIVEAQIEKSKSHWSTLAEFPSKEEEYVRPRRTWRRLLCWCSNVDGDDVCLAEVSNVEEFLALQRNPKWGGFFGTFGYDTEIWESLGEMEVGEKFAEGGQGELFHAHVTSRDPKRNEEDLRDGTKYVLKVFKKGTFLKHLKSQLPHGLLHEYAWRMENLETLNLYPRYSCKVHCGTLLKDGRFAFLMRKEDFDLRTLIERNMKSRNDPFYGPFSKEEAEQVMYGVALGVEWLHYRDIIHRDLKASNVLVNESKSGYSKWLVFVADYECSVGVVGMGFFRAPEILQVCKEQKWRQVPKVFSRAADVYAYGMICYEILTGKLPFEDHPLSKNYPLLIDLVIDQHLRPEVPEYVENWTHELLSRCWHSDPKHRPPIGEILDVLLVNSKSARESEESLKEVFGQNYRRMYPARYSNFGS